MTTYRANIWSAMDGELEKFGNRKVIKKARRDRIMKLVNYWRRTQ